MRVLLSECCGQTKLPIANRKTAPNTKPSTDAKQTACGSGSEGKTAAIAHNSSQLSFVSGRKSTAIMLAPLRMFISELPAFVHNNPNNCNCLELRLMGRVTEIIHDTTTSISSSQVNQACQETVLTFIIDDGTSLLDVVAFGRQPPIKEGELVDCIGKVQCIDGESSPNNQSQWNYHFSTSSVSIVSNQQEEVLRQMELSSKDRSSKVDCDALKLANNHSTHKIPKNRVLTTESLEQKLNPLNHKSHPYQSITANTDDLFRYISYSSKYGGISRSELESLLGATICREKVAVREGIEELQMSGMVYMQNGKYFEL
jgi:hypothetical protein